MVRSNLGTEKGVTGRIISKNLKTEIPYLTFTISQSLRDFESTSNSLTDFATSGRVLNITAVESIPNNPTTQNGSPNPPTEYSNDPNPGPVMQKENSKLIRCAQYIILANLQ